ncbi:MAG: M42 family metallopeptidase [Candidatus Helarchaeota archaeon]|nr:M42 family metallopeptidase [Candidatus Helarchaeota archaeon]
MSSLLKKLLDINAASGFEHEMREFLKERLRPAVDEVYTDSLGTIICSKYGPKKKPKVMIAAHMDEIGMLIKFIDENGFLYFAPLGGVLIQAIANQRVIIQTEKGTVPGIIGTKSIHQQTEKERKQPLEMDSIFIDVGATSREDVENLGISIGNPVIWQSSFKELVNNRVCGKAFDNRIGIYILINVLEQAKFDGDLIGAFTVMEEIGLRGARTSAFSIEPDVGIALDVSAAGDYPSIKHSNIKMGAGPTITVASGRKASLGGGFIAHPKVYRLLVDTAKNNSIPYQLEIFQGGTTDATSIALSRGGIPCGSIGIPTRYLHTPVELLSMDDVENAIKLILFALKKIHTLF